MRTRRSAQGLLAKVIDVRIVVLDIDGHEEKSVRHRIHAEPGAWLSTKALVNVLRQESDMLAQELAAYDWNLVSLGPYRVNLIGKLKGSDGLPTLDTVYAPDGGSSLTHAQAAAAIDGKQEIAP